MKNEILSNLQHSAKITALLGFIYSKTEHARIKLAAVKTLETIVQDLTVEEYRSLCIAATRIWWDNKNETGKPGLEAIIMLPTTQIQNSIYFTSSGDVTVIADQPSVAATSGFQPTPPAPSPELAAFCTVYGNIVKPVQLSPANTPLNASNDRMRTCDNGTIAVQKTVTTFPIGLIMLATNQGNQYINECLLR